MVATSGAKLISDDAVQVLKEELFGLADILTPNIPEAEVLSGMDIKTEEDMAEAAEKIGSLYPVSYTHLMHIWENCLVHLSSADF